MPSIEAIVKNSPASVFTNPEMRKKLAFEVGDMVVFKKAMRAEKPSLY